MPAAAPLLQHSCPESSSGTAPSKKHLPRSVNPPICLSVCSSPFSSSSSFFNFFFNFCFYSFTASFYSFPTWRELGWGAELKGQQPPA